MNSIRLKWVLGREKDDVGSVPDCLLFWSPPPAGPAVRVSMQLPAGSSYSRNLLSLPLSTEWKEASSRQSYSQPFPSSKEKPAWTQSSISVCGNLLVAWPPCSGEGSLTRSCLFQPRRRLLGTRAGSSTELILRAHCFTQLLLAGYGP